MGGLTDVFFYLCLGPCCKAAWFQMRTGLLPIWSNCRGRRSAWATPSGGTTVGQPKEVSSSGGRIGLDGVVVVMVVVARGSESGSFPIHLPLKKIPLFQIYPFILPEGLSTVPEVQAPPRGPGRPKRRSRDESTGQFEACRGMGWAGVVDGGAGNNSMVYWRLELRANPPSLSNVCCFINNTGEWSCPNKPAAREEETKAGVKVGVDDLTAPFALLTVQHITYMCPPNINENDL